MSKALIDELIARADAYYAKGHPVPLDILVLLDEAGIDISQFV